MSRVLNVLHPGTKSGNAWAIAYVLLTRAQVLLTRISCLTRSLRWLTRTTVLLTPQPYKGPLASHEHKGLERGSHRFITFHYGRSFTNHGQLDAVALGYSWIIRFFPSWPWPVISFLQVAVFLLLTFLLTFLVFWLLLHHPQGRHIFLDDLCVNLISVLGRLVPDLAGFDPFQIHVRCADVCLETGRNTIPKMGRNIGEQQNAGLFIPQFVEEVWN